jgi:hypothetical protein
MRHAPRAPPLVSSRASRRGLARRHQSRRDAGIGPQIRACRAGCESAAPEGPPAVSGHPPRRRPSGRRTESVARRGGFVSCSTAWGQQHPDRHRGRSRRRQDVEDRTQYGRKTTRDRDRAGDPRFDESSWPAWSKDGKPDNGRPCGTVNFTPPVALPPRCGENAECCDHLRDGDAWRDGPYHPQYRDADLRPARCR